MSSHALFTITVIGLGRAYRANCVTCPWMSTTVLSRDAAVQQHTVHAHGQPVFA